MLKIGGNSPKPNPGEGKPPEVPTPGAAPEESKAQPPKESKSKPAKGLQLGLHESVPGAKKRKGALWPKLVLGAFVLCVVIFLGAALVQRMTHQEEALPVASGVTDDSETGDFVPEVINVPDTVAQPGQGVDEEDDHDHEQGGKPLDPAPVTKATPPGVAAYSNGIANVQTLYPDHFFLVEKTAEQLEALQTLSQSGASFDPKTVDLPTLLPLVDFDAQDSAGTYISAVLVPAKLADKTTKGLYATSVPEGFTLVSVSSSAEAKLGKVSGTQLDFVMKQYDQSYTASQIVIPFGANKLVLVYRSNQGADNGKKSEYLAEIASNFMTRGEGEVTTKPQATNGASAGKSKP